MQLYPILIGMIMGIILSNSMLSLNTKHLQRGFIIYPVSLSDFFPLFLRSIHYQNFWILYRFLIYFR